MLITPVFGDFDQIMQMDMFSGILAKLSNTMPRSVPLNTERSSGADPGFGQGGAPASEAESCQCSEVESHKRSEHSAAGVQGPLKGPGSFWVFDAEICILTHSRDSFSLIFDIYFDTKS